MGIRKLKPITPGTRFMSVNDFAELTTDRPLKALTVGKKSTGGRNNQGRRTARYRGGGHKRRYRIIDFKRDKFGIPAKVHSIEYDPNRNAWIARLHYADGEKRYIIAPEGLKVGDTVVSGEQTEVAVGNAMKLKNIPFGTLVHNVELHPGKGGQLARAAGTYAQVTGKEGKYVILRLPSSEIRKVLGECMATIGVVSNAVDMNIVIGKAGRNRWLGRRPRTRAVAMNPVDHPMGGGEGKHSGGHPRSRNGLYAKGKKTRKKHKYSDIFIIARRRKKAKDK